MPPAQVVAATMWSQTATRYAVCTGYFFFAGFGGPSSTASMTWTIAFEMRMDAMMFAPLIVTCSPSRQRGLPAARHPSSLPSLGVRRIDGF